VRECISSGTFTINCPEYNCPQYLYVGHIKRLLAENEYERYQYFLDKNQKELDPNNRFCSRPDCGEVLGRNNGKLHCLKCKVDFCEICLQASHEGTKCDIALKTALEHAYSACKIKYFLF
jgi:ribosomal protein S27AE